MNSYPLPTFHAPLTLWNLFWVKKICIKSRNKVHFSAAVMAGSMKPCIVIALDTLYNHTPMTWCPWPSFPTPVTLSKFDIKSRDDHEVHFSAAAIAVSMKFCIVIVNDTLFKHTSWHGALDLHFTLHWLCQNFALSQDFVLASFRMEVNNEPDGNRAPLGLTAYFKK